MDIKEFGQVMVREVGDMLGEGYEIDLRDIVKNNGIVRHALVIKKEKNNIAPTIYIDELHKAYESGAVPISLAKDVVSLYRRSQPSDQMDVSFFLDFSKVAPKLFFKAVNYEKNRKKLRDIPIKRVLDLALVPLCRFISESVGDGCITIQKSHLKEWEISEQELWENVVENAARVAPVKVSGLMDMMDKLIPVSERSDEVCGIYVATNTSMYLGAGVIFYPNMLKELADYHESDLFIIPSSVHETLIIPDTNMIMDIESLRDMICEVNRTAVADEEILSDNLYVYDRENGSMFIAKG
jgi:hypothetical protein